MVQTDEAEQVTVRKPAPVSAPIRRKSWQDGTWRRGRIIAGLAVLAAVPLALHGLLPNPGNLAGLLETFLPWCGLVVPVLLVPALLRRSATALVALLVPAAVWLAMFGGTLGDRSTGKGDLTVVTHNVAAANTDVPGTVKMLIDSGADLIALEELEPRVQPEYERGLAAAYPHHVAGISADGLWSKYPITGSGMAKSPAGEGSGTVFRSVVATPKGEIAVYVGHLDSVRVTLGKGFGAELRDNSIAATSAALRAEPLERVLLMGDLNGSLADRAFAPITEQMTSAHEAAGSGFGFTWPTAFPAVRIDHILSKGRLTATDSWVLPADGSDHRAVAASYRY
ncbi:endonuclease/exonuclease/phosphatase family protein [Streptomyces sp. NBC_01006]|uniref:endonuclease/exonuclease/phosphatase family protein n=1 Tax=Streptomyces sp. NBC_01006 TaxID=2903716 RepID=UPI003863CEB3|nr:endonuclease/exonuclease/phosphatase family protein [Streptomyces sp. NBC_01006]